MSLSIDNTGDSKGQGCSYSREQLLLVIDNTTTNVTNLLLLLTIQVIVKDKDVVTLGSSCY